jgi:hypothetical protein
LVHTDDGLLRIDQVRPGMSVLSGDPVTGNTSYQTVLDQYSNDYDKTVYITYEGMDGPEEITSNTIRPFFVVLDETTPRLVAQSAEGHIYEGPIKGGAWVDAVHLRPGHSLRTPDGTLRKVLTVNITAEPLTAYNLTVDQTETYFVGEEPVWVHNCPKRVGDFKAATKTTLKQENATHNGGVMKCSDCQRSVHNQVGKNKRGEGIDSGRAEVDHNKELADGGTADASNGQILCHDCHKKKTIEFRRKRAEDRKANEHRIDDND